MQHNDTPEVDVIELDDETIAQLDHNDPNRVADDSHDVPELADGDFAPDDNEE